MTTENDYVEITPEESFLLSIPILIGLELIPLTILSFFTPLYSDLWWLIIIPCSIFNIVWVVSGFIKRPMIKPNQLGALKILGKPRYPYVFSGDPFRLRGIMSFEIRTVGENNVSVEPIELSAGDDKNAQVRMQMKIKIRYIVYDIFTEISIAEGSGLDLLKDLVESSARELISFNTDEKLMSMRSIPSEKENIRQKIWDKIAQLDPDKDTKSNHPIEVPIKIGVWGIKVLGIFVHDIMPADKEIVEAYASVRKSQLRAKGEKAQNKNLIENAKEIQNSFPDVSGPAALRRSQIEDEKPGIFEIVWDEPGGNESGKAGDFTKSTVTKHVLDERKGGDKKDSKK